MPTITPMLTLQEVAKRLNLSRRTVYRIMRDDPTFPTKRIRDEPRVDPDALEAWIARQPRP